MDNLPFLNHNAHPHILSQPHIASLAQQQLLQGATTLPIAIPQQDVWLKLQHMTARYNDLLRQSRDIAARNQALVNEHLRLQKELLTISTKNEELSIDAFTHRIEVWRANVRLEELSNELQLLKNHRSQLLFEQIDNDGESAWSASCSSPLSSALSASTFPTSSTTTPTSSATAPDPLTIPNSTPNSIFHSPPSHQATTAEEVHHEPISGNRKSKRRKIARNSVGDCKSEATDAVTQRLCSAAATPMGMMQEQGIIPEWTGPKLRSTTSQRQRTATHLRTHSPPTAVKGPGMRTRSRTKLAPEQEAVEEFKPVAAATAMFDSSASLPGLPPCQPESS